MSTMRVVTKREVIRGIPKRFAEIYDRHKPDYVIGMPGMRKSVGELRANIAALDFETCSAADVDAAMAATGWAANCCDECGADQDSLVRIGDEPDFEARWQDLCRECLTKARELLP